MQDSRKKEKVKATIRLSVESGLSIPTKCIVNKIYIVHQTFFFPLLIVKVIVMVLYIIICADTFFYIIYDQTWTDT